MFGSTNSREWAVLWDLRLPRVILSAAVGAGLAVSGAVLQAVFSNPLCEPYTLGISSGAALGAVIGSTFGLDLSFAGLTGAGFVGAAVFSMMLLGVSMRRNVGIFGLLLTGVMLGFIGSSLVALWMALSDPSGVQGAILWLMGDLTRARPIGAWVSLVISVVLIMSIWSRSADLDALLTGEESALSLGVSVRTLRRAVVFITSLLIGVCVSGAGMIGFVGLVVPHLVRRTSGSLHGRLIPMVAVWGAISVMGADLVARVVLRPYELPVGVVTALIGAPAFLWIMLRTRGGATE